VGRGVRENRVTIDLEHYTADAERRLQETYGADLVVVAHADLTNEAS
jgi:hypothetical protein